MTKGRMKPQSWYEKRNKKLFNDYEKGLQIKELVKKYDLSSARIYQIVRKFDEKEE